MRDSEPEQQVVLVGGGHAHIEVLRQFAMRPLEGVSLVIVMDRTTSAYSGMVPDVIAGRAAREDLEMDVWPLARRAGATVIEARMVGLDVAIKHLHLEGRPSLYWDLCSLDIGGSVAGLNTPGVRSNAVATRPLATLLERLSGGHSSMNPLVAGAIVVVGGGPAGVELAFAMRARFPEATVTLVDRGAQILGAGGRWQRRLVVSALAEHRIEVRTGVGVSAVHPGHVELSSGEELGSDLTLWSTGAAPHPALKDAGLPVSERGFVLLEDDLRVLGRDDLFAAGDCAVPASRPDLPRAGVYAVRMGPYLAHNLRATLQNRPLQTYRPQRDMLTLLNVSDGTAIASKWGFSGRSASWYRWKNRIDREWLSRYQGDALPKMPAVEMACLGCAAKVPPAVLSSVLDGRVAGDVGDDAALIDVGAPVAWTVDVFPAFSDDAFFVAKVAAGHALADLWAKGVAPSHALAILTIPRGTDAVVSRVFSQVMEGLSTVLHAHGIALSGGHTVLGEALSIGLTAVGPAHGFLHLSGATAGDALLLTRALGTGIALRADARGEMSGSDMKAVLASMDSVDSGLVVLADQVSTATDVSGFGLANHLLDLCRASGCGAELDLDALPVLPGVLAAVSVGVRSTASPGNERAAASDLAIPEHPKRPLLFDPQTGGGVLLAVPRSNVAEIVNALGAVCIGRLVPVQPGALERAT